MSSNDILQQGADLLMLGMGSVFVFLSVLVVATTAMSWFINRWLPEVEAEPVARKPAPSTEINSKTLSIIKQAIAQHRVAKGRASAE
ncbi:OadG family protein [Umboniibacter marinipuniceus]|uniref:Probable oxaloacetate decarboxylase gamma chain n=1 Tax=Umboniibacter marinipuniceus TaxID=569599 RepID=A0A3M0AF24_9GAMM|nr:OadG family transporter subunit [Umboniibacter marinipuniceus]RMA81358.1 oxaloacetate decarboxylase gamma subunit [Umboniibacter marinipuniceus]